jgi:hypothetical protein
MQTCLRVERYRQNKKLKPAYPNARMPFGDLTIIQMPGIMDFFFLVFNKLFHMCPLLFWIVFFILEDVDDYCKIDELPMSGVIQTPDYQALREKTRQQTHLRVQRCQQNKDITSSGGKSQTPLKDVSNTQHSGTVSFYYIVCSRYPWFLLSSFNGLVYL